MATKKVVASFELEASQAKQSLAELRAAEEAFVAQGNALATDLTSGFEKIEQGVGKAFDKLNEGTKVSQGQFDTLVNKLAALRQAVEDSGKSLEEMPEEFQTAFQKAQQQLASLADGMDRQAEASRLIKEEFRQLGDAAREMGQDTEVAGSDIRQAAQRAEAAFEKFGQVMIENPKEALELLPRVAAQVIQLRNEIDKAQKAGGPVDPQDIARLKQFETQLEAAKNEARSMKIEIDKATAGVNDASQSWQGFDGVMNDLAGRFGKTGVAAVGMWAAIKEGWSVGMQLNQLFGTDMGEWDKSLERFGAKMKGIITAFSDGIIATGGMVAALLSGDMAEIKRAWTDLTDAEEAFRKAGHDALTQWGADWDNAHPKIAKNTEEVQKLGKAVQGNAAVWAAYVAQLKEAAEAAKKHAEETAKAQLERQIGYVASLAEATNTLADANRNAGESAAEAASHSELQVAAVNAELDAVRALLEARGVDLDARNQMKQINLDAGASTEYLLMKERELEASLASQVTSWTATSTAQTEQKDARAELAAIVEREKAAQEGLTRSVGTVRVEYENGIPVIKNTAAETGKLVGVLENGKVVYANLDDAQRKATASGISFGENAKNVKQSAAEAAETMAGLATSAGDLATRLADVDKYLDSVNKKMREMKAAAAEAAGDDEAEAKTS